MLQQCRCEICQAGVLLDIYKIAIFGLHAVLTRIRTIHIAKFAYLPPSCLPIHDADQLIIKVMLLLRNRFPIKLAHIEAEVGFEWHLNGGDERNNNTDLDSKLDIRAQSERVTLDDTLLSN